MFLYVIGDIMCYTIFIKQYIYLYKITTSKSPNNILKGFNEIQLHVALGPKKHMGRE